MKKDYFNQNDKRIVLKDRNAIIPVDLKNITIITCDGYLSMLYFLDNRKPISVSKLLKKFEEELTPNGFFRVNRNTLVNIKNVYSFQNRSNRTVTMVDNHKISVSFRKIPQFRKLLEWV